MSCWWHDETEHGPSQLAELTEIYRRVQLQRLLLAAGHVQGSHIKGATARDWGCFLKII
jgi:hypothetical protein